MFCHADSIALDGVPNLGQNTGKATRLLHLRCYRYATFPKVKNAASRLLAGSSGSLLLSTQYPVV